MQQLHGVVLQSILMAHALVYQKVIGCVMATTMDKHMATYASAKAKVYSRDG